MQIVNAIKHVHENGFRCGDLKIENMLLRPDDTIILIDTDSFKKASVFDDTTPRTASYCAPEIQIQKVFDEQKADIFALGCILYFFAYEQDPPWCYRDEKSDNDVFSFEQDFKLFKQNAIRADKNLKNSANCPITIDDLLKNLADWSLHPDPTERPTIDAIYSVLKRPCSDDSK